VYRVYDERFNVPNRFERDFYFKRRLTGNARISGQRDKRACLAAPGEPLLTDNVVRRK